MLYDDVDNTTGNCNGSLFESDNDGGRCKIARDFGKIPFGLLRH